MMNVPYRTMTIAVDKDTVKSRWNSVEYGLNFGRLTITFNWSNAFHRVLDR